MSKEWTEQNEDRAAANAVAAKLMEGGQVDVGDSIDFDATVGEEPPGWVTRFKGFEVTKEILAQARRFAEEAQDRGLP